MARRGTTRIVTLALLAVVAGSAAAAWGYHQHADAELTDEREIAALLMDLQGTTDEHATAHGPAFFRTSINGGAENIVMTYDVTDLDAATADLQARLTLAGWRRDEAAVPASGHPTDWSNGDDLWVRVWAKDGSLRLWIGEIGG